MILADTLSISINLLLVAHVVVSLLLILVVLMQRPKQEGLGAAFGGGVTDQMFGAQTTNVLQKGTVYLGAAFLILSLVLAILIGNQNYTAAMDQPAPDKVEEAPAVPDPEVLPDGGSIKEELDKTGGSAPTGTDATPEAGDDSTPATGDDSTPATGDDSTPATGDDSTPATGDDSAPATGDDSTPATGDDSTPATGDDSTPAEGASTGSAGPAADPAPSGDPSEDIPE